MKVANGRRRQLPGALPLQVRASGLEPVVRCPGCHLAHIHHIATGRGNATSSMRLDDASLLIKARALVQSHGRLGGATPRSEPQTA